MHLPTSQRSRLDKPHGEFHGQHLHLNTGMQRPYVVCDNMMIPFSAGAIPLSLSLLSCCRDGEEEAVEIRLWTQAFVSARLGQSQASLSTPPLKASTPFPTLLLSESGGRPAGKGYIDAHQWPTRVVRLQHGGRPFYASYSTRKYIQHPPPPFLHNTITSLYRPSFGLT